MFPSNRQPSHTLPSQPADPNAKPSGKSTVTNSTVKEEIEDVELENMSAIILAKSGYVVEQNPDANRLSGLNYRYKGKPDYIIENVVFDGYAPRTSTTLENIFDVILSKSNLQASRIVLNMQRNKGDLDHLKDWLARYHQTNLPNLWRNQLDCEQWA